MNGISRHCGLDISLVFDLQGLQRAFKRPTLLRLTNTNDLVLQQRRDGS